MKYVTLFHDTSSANGFEINYIPWIGWENQRERALHCNEPNKKILIHDNVIDIIDNTISKNIYYINDVETSLQDMTWNQMLAMTDGIEGAFTFDKLYIKEPHPIIYNKNYNNYTQVDLNTTPIENARYYTTKPLIAFDYLHSITNYVPIYNENTWFNTNLDFQICLGFIVGWISSLGEDFLNVMNAIVNQFRIYDCVDINNAYYEQGISIGLQYAIGEIILTDPYSVVYYIDGMFMDDYFREYFTRDEQDEFEAFINDIRDTYLAPYILGGSKETWPIDPAYKFFEYTYNGRTYYLDGRDYSPPIGTKCAFIANILIMLLPISVLEYDEINSLDLVDSIIMTYGFNADSYPANILPGQAYGVQLMDNWIQPL